MYFSFISFIEEIFDMSSNPTQIIAALFIPARFKICVCALILSFNFTVLAQDECIYTITPPSVNVSTAGGSNSFLISVDSICTWFVMNNTPWITVNSPSSGYGDAFISYTVQPNSGGARIGVINVSGEVFTVNQAGSATTYRAPYDFDGDSKTDVSIYRPAVGEWWILKSSNGSNAAFQFGNSSDRIVPADYTGDGKCDVAIFRPVSGEWFILRSEDSSYYSFPFGTAGDIPAPADFDGDAKADAAVFRPSAATWFISRSTGGTTIQAFGAANDTPVAADFDGDAKADIAIYRALAGEWWIYKSSNSSTIAFVFGNSADNPVPGDYTGDGKADVAIFRPSTGEWFVLRSENASYYSFPFGTSGDISAPGDFDGDAKFDASVFRPSSSTWFVQRSTAGTLIQAFGISGDQPVPSAFIP